MRNKSKSRPDHSKVDWRNLVKDGEKFRKFKFFSARFEFSKLTNCDFSAVSAKRACFIRADLSGSDFTGANLEGANFGGANLTGVNFKSAILKHANFENAIVDKTNFLNVNLNLVKKLKLSESQQREIEEAKQAEKARTAADLAARKAKKEAELNQ
ncbi:pentapeptide repeat-containing protein [Salinicola halophyticus]|uniref:pentapeptide repeat-containing protein n=1 Tax=Salinicola halophyticus TaxID=1808881 RepID=UPI003F48980D